MSVDTLSTLIFAGIILVTLAITLWASRKNNDVSHQYAAGGEIKSWQNGLALASDYISAGFFLGLAGLIVLSGFPALYGAIVNPVAFLLLLLVLGEPMRKLGKYTIADMIRTRFNAKKVRTAVALSTVVISTMYMISQLVGAGLIIELLLGVEYSISVIVIGLLMATYVAIGGMVGTTWIQIVQAVLLLTGLTLMSVLLLSRFSFNPVALFNEVAEQMGPSVLRQPQGTFFEGLDWISFALANVLGAAALPHVLIRFVTVRDTDAARNSTTILVWILVVATTMIVLVGYGAMLLVGPGVIENASAGGNLAVPLLAERLGGPVLLAFIGAAAFGAILSTVSGLTIAATGALAHDLYNNVIRNAEASEQEQLWASRIVVVFVAIVAILLALVAQSVNITILVVLTFAVAASANLPLLLLTLFWERFNSRGAITCVLVGLGSALILATLGPNIMGENALFPLGNPALLSIPLGFLGAYIGTLIGEYRTQENERETQVPYTEIHVRSNIGITSSRETEG